VGNSTTSLQNIFDRAASKGIPTPLMNTPAGYGTDLAIEMGNDVMSDIIQERFNWKWNRVTAPFFLSNSFQQDYPQVGITNMGWLEDCDRVDINNTALPKPIRQLTCRRGLSRTSIPWAPVSELCWMYNSDLIYGAWPGAGVTFYPLIASVVQQNPIMNFQDVNGNLLIVKTFGTTGVSAPSASVNAPEGTIVVDGSMTWVVVAPNSQGFRINPIPGGAGPTWQIIPYYQMTAPKLTTLQSLLSPIPDFDMRHFQKGVETYCLKGSPNPGDAKRAESSERDWFAAMDRIKREANKETDSYALLPATSPVENPSAWTRNPLDPSQPY
jgi:hypothetical protein